MSVRIRALHAVVLVAGLLGCSGIWTRAMAQGDQRNERRGYAPPPQTVRATQSRPRIGTAAQPRIDVGQRFSPRHRFGQVAAPAIVYYVPVPSGDGYGYGYGGGVYDTDGRPLYA